MTYVDGYVIPIAKERVDGYRRMAEEACEVWMDHGAVDYKECIAEDLEPGVPDTEDHPMGGFPDMTDLGPDETVVFAWIAFESREHRDEVNAAVMEDPRIAGMDGMEDPGAMPFDVKRMAYAGFDVLVDGAA